MLTIKILGTGCPNCKKVEEIARSAVVGLVINENLVCAGRIPSHAEVVTWLANALETA